MSIKRTAADKAFSEAVRESFDYDCVACGKNGRHNPGMMDCSHVFSRKHRSTRWTVANALSLCRSCHQKMADRPLVHAELVREWLGQAAYDDLLAKHHKPVKVPRSMEKAISAHYRAETKRIELLRAAGHRGYIKLEDWNSAD